MTGTVRVSQDNPNLWWFVLAATNVGALVLLLCLVVGPAGSVVGLVAGAALWLVADAVVIPIAVVQLGRRLTLDFDRGTLTTGGTVHPASEFVSMIETARSFPGRAHLLTLVYRRGRVDIQVDGFAPTARSRARDEAVLAFLWQWLPAPTQHRSPIDAGPMRTTSLIGKQEAAALLSASR